jgi:hypothetical protein
MPRYSRNLASGKPTKRSAYPPGPWRRRLAQVVAPSVSYDIGGMMIVVASLRLSCFFAVANAWVRRLTGRPLIHRLVGILKRKGARCDHEVGVNEGDAGPVDAQPGILPIARAR